MPAARHHNDDDDDDDDDSTKLSRVYTKRHVKVIVKRN